MGTIENLETPCVPQPRRGLNVVWPVSGQCVSGQCFGGLASGQCILNCQEPDELWHIQSVAACDRPKISCVLEDSYGYRQILHPVSHSPERA